MNALERLQDLFRELFQFDVADLDFGIYRLLHMKRDEVEIFLAKDLPATVEREFRAAAGAEHAALQANLKELADRIRQDIGPDALQSNGEPAPTYVNAKLVKDYAAKRNQLEGIEATEAQKAEVFNHLYTFFRRYYDDGDFIPRRFYGARESYAVPYNGEEVLFHWANRDQHYVKTGEAFRDYAFKIETVLGPFTVRFKLTQATTAKDNSKGDVRFFFALPKDAQYDKAARTFVVPFEYRLPTEAEVQRYGSGAKGQAALTLEATKKILAAAPDDLLKTELANVVDIKNPEDTTKREEVTLLLKRLRHFTRKNTTDYFIHKNLGGFLRQELEFYIKDQVVQAADLEGDFDAKRRMLRVLRALAEQIIAFLHQIEEAQRRLFEKKKFVLQTNYLVPIQNVPRKLWAEVLANTAQLEAWKDLFAIEPKKDLLNRKGTVNEQFLREHPTLVVNTAHFDPDFTAGLLAAFQDVDEVTDGVLFQSENDQVLRLLAARYNRRVKCIYIDPPYNTGFDGFVYKDRYQHSSWLGMMAGRLQLASRIVHTDGVVFLSCDDHELERLKLVLHEAFTSGGFATTLIWKARLFTDARPTNGVSLDHEYVLAYGTSTTARFRGKEKDLTKYSNPDHDPRGPWTSCSLLGKATKEQRPNLHYEFSRPDTGEVYRCPKNTGWICAKDTMLTHVIEKRILWPKKKGGRPRVKVFLNELRSEFMGFPSVIDDVFTSDGTAELRDLFGAQVYPFPKPSDLIRKVVEQQADSAALVCDFFAGSGTTAHAVIALNRQSGGHRRFILAEMGGFFESITLGRIQKVLYAPEWKDGRPRRLPTSVEAERTPRLVTVLRLESYEDALHNVAKTEMQGRTAKKAEAVRATAGEERYRLNYLVKLPLEASDTVLNVEKLEHPFSYTIEVLTDDGPREQTVDLIETFNWLYGLRVKRLLAWEAKQGKGSRKYRVVVATDRDNRKRILVVWRDMAGLDPKAERAFLEAEVAKLGDFEEKWINGDCAVPGFASLDGLFKRLMEGQS